MVVVVEKVVITSGGGGEVLITLGSNGRQSIACLGGVQF